MSLKRQTNFLQPDVLREDKPFLGSTVGVWHRAFTSGMQNTLDEEKQRCANASAERASDLTIVTDMAHSTCGRK